MRTLRSASIALLIAIVTITPAGLAAWGFSGNHEPDTQSDVDSGFAYKSAYTGSENRVYFNGFRDAIGTQGASPSVNLATAGTQFQTPSYRHVVLFGVWKDCNADGFVGLGDNGLLEYRAEIPKAEGGNDPAICPPGTIPDPIPMNWHPIHNDGQWIHEYLPIAWSQSGVPDANPWNYNDNSSRAWFDFGQPATTTGSVAGGTCIINPPTGSMHSTGGLVWWLDCLATGYQGTDTFNSLGNNFTPCVNNPDALKPSQGDKTCKATGVSIDHLGAGQLTFSDKPRDQYASQSQLNKKNPWGEQSDGSDATVWDCNGPKTFAPRDPTSPSDGQPGSLYKAVDDPTWTPADHANATVGDNQDGKINGTFSDGYLVHGANVSAVSTSPGVGTTGSPAGTANATASGIDQCTRRTDSNGGNAATVANAPYSQELPISQSAAKINADGAFSGGQAARPNYAPQGTRQVPGAVPVVGGTFVGDVGAVLANVTGRGTDRAPAAAHNLGSTEGFWVDNFIWFAPGFPFTSYITYYGFVSQTAIDAYGLVLPGSVGAYGDGACQGATTGVVGGFDCDASHWYKGSDGKDVSIRSPYLGQDQTLTGPCTPSATAQDTTAVSRGCVEISPVAGSPYNLRDLDCTDSVVPAARGDGTPVFKDTTGQVGDIGFCPTVDENK